MKSIIRGGVVYKETEVARGRIPAPSALTSDAIRMNPGLFLLGNSSGALYPIFFQFRVERLSKA
jgi:hypothetical protein